MANLGGPELVIILVVVLLIFGPGRLPAMSRSVSEALREFRKAQDDDASEVDTNSGSGSGTGSSTGSGSGSGS